MTILSIGGQSVSSWLEVQECLACWSVYGPFEKFCLETSIGSVHVMCDVSESGCCEVTQT